MPSDRWTWVAILNDGTRIPESQVETFKAVDPERCIAIELISARGIFRKRIRINVDLTAGQRAVFVRRRRKTVNLNTGAERMDGTITRAGWENGTARAFVCGYDDGHLEMTSEP